MFYSVCKSKSTKKRKQQGDDDKINKGDGHGVNKEKMGQWFHNTYMMKFRS
jgi:hypothetical protein